MGDVVGDFLGFGGAGQFNFGPPVGTQSDINSPSYKLHSSIGGDGYVLSNISRLPGSTVDEYFKTRLPRILGDIDTLRGTFKPGFSELRAARMGRLESARTRAIGNLYDELSRRRVAGSSFGFDSLARAEREFGQAESEEMAKSFLEELDANTKLLGFEAANLTDAMNRELAELQIAQGQAIQSSQLVSNNMQFMQKMMYEADTAQAAAGVGFLGSLLNLGVSAFSQGGPFGKPLPSSPPIVIPRFGGGYGTGGGS